MEKNVPVLVGIAVVGAISGVLIAGNGTSFGSVSAAPGGEVALSPITTIAGLGPIVSTAGSTPVTTVVVDTTTTTTVLTDSQAVPPAPETTVAPPPETAAPVVTDDIPLPVVTDDMPVFTIAPESPDETAPPDEPPPPWTASMGKAAMRLVIANADPGRPDLEQPTAQMLNGLGYTQLAVGTDVAGLPETTIYFRAGFNRAAVTVAMDLGTGTLEPLPDGATLTDVDAAGDVIVLLGPDLP